MSGKDGLVRAGNIRTAQGKINRPITKLIPLEVSQSSDVTSSAADDTKNCISDHAQATDSGSISLTQLPSSNHSKITSEIKDPPQRLAAWRGRDKVKNWIQALGCLQEDVTDTED